MSMTHLKVNEEVIIIEVVIVKVVLIFLDFIVSLNDPFQALVLYSLECWD